MTGLPIRSAFGSQSQLMGTRTSPSGVAYQRTVRSSLGIKPELLDAPVVLVMGGGEGVGSLSDIVDATYLKLKHDGLDATVAVICGRNEALKDDLNSRNWAATPPVEEASKIRKLWRRLRTAGYNKFQKQSTAPVITTPVSKDATVDVKGIG